MADNLTPAVRKLLRKAGCRFERQGRGDHEIRYSPITERRFMVDAQNQVPPLGQPYAEAGGPGEGVLTATVR